MVLSAHSHHSVIEAIEAVMKASMLLVVLLSAVVSVSHASVTKDKLNPITRVVELLQGLVKKCEEDAKAEEDLFDAYFCWAKTVIKTKTASNADAAARIENLEAYIADIEAGRVEFTSERGDLTAQIKSLNEEIETATDMREKEHEDYLAAKDEMEKAIAALEQAVEVLAAGTAEKKEKGELLSLRREMGRLEGGLEEGERMEASMALQRAVQMGKNYLSKGDAEFLERVLTGEVPTVDWKKLNRKAGFKMKYKARSGKIQKILGDMLQTFKDNLADATAKEKEAKANYDKLMGTKKDELGTAEEALTDGNKEGSARNMAKDEAQQEVDDLKAQIEADEGYIKDTEEAYGIKMEEFKERKKLRKLEIASINKAIAILSSDDAKDTFNKSFKSQGYLLLQKTARSKQQKQASAIVRRAGIVAKDPRLQALAMQVLLQQGGHFDKVIEAIDKMVANLREEEAEDLKNNEECEKERFEKTKEARTLSLEIDDATEEIARQRSLIEELKAQIAEKEAEIKQLKEDLDKATRQREDEKMAYEASSADDHAAVELIKKAMDTLKGFYEDNGLTLVQRLAAQRGAAPGEAPPPPPPTPSEPYGGAKGESTGIQAILGMILEDVEKDIKKADEEEKAAIEEFEKFKEDTEKSIEAAEKAIDDMKGDIADAETAIEEQVEVKTKAKNTLDSIMEEIKVITPGCDFIAVNIEVRAKNRQLEIDGLLKAKAILEGAAFGM